MIDLGKKNVLYAGDQLVKELYLGNKKIEDYRVIEVKNEVVNGDFEQGTTGWNTTSAGILENGELIMIRNGSRWTQPINIPVGNIVYLRAKTYVTMHGGSGSAGRISYGNVRIQNETPEPMVLSEIGETSNQTLMISTFHLNQDTREHYDDIVLIDLTGYFGEGNEPSKEWCDEHLHFYDNNKQGIRL